MMGSSREIILNKLRKANPKSSVSGPDDYLPMVPIVSISQSKIEEQFVAQAIKMGCQVHQPESQRALEQILMDLIGSETRVQHWGQGEHFPERVANFLSAHWESANPYDSDVSVGITGADAGLAATGSLVLKTGAGKSRLTSLLPEHHIAILSKSNILLDFESWFSQERDQGIEKFRELASVMIITGPSRTADIEMRLVMGMHGPRSLDIILID